MDFLLTFSKIETSNLNIETSNLNPKKELYSPEENKTAVLPDLVLGSLTVSRPHSPRAQSLLSPDFIRVRIPDSQLKL